jgi:hypothetical protein
MQTWLPYPSFRHSARVLDDRRLGKQRLEALGLLSALRGHSDGWLPHPATRMWRGYEDALLLYALVVTREWKRRGYADTVEAKLLPLWEGRPRRLPPWFGDPAFHRAHQSSLVRKDPAFYRPRFPDVPDDLPYVWPAGTPLDLPPPDAPAFARALQAGLGGDRLSVTSPHGRFAKEAEVSNGRVLERVEGEGAVVRMDWEGGGTLRVDLGRQGRFEERSGAPEGYVRLRLAGPRATFDLVAPRSVRLA